MAAQHLRGKIDNICWGGGPINIAFCDRASELDRTTWSPHQRHHNQPMYAGAGAGRARGWFGSFGFTSGCLSNFWPGGGLDTAILRPGRRKQSSRLVSVNNNTTIKQWMKGRPSVLDQGRRRVHRCVGGVRSRLLWRICIHGRRLRAGRRQGRSGLAPWGRRTTAAPVDSIIASKAIVIAIVVVAVVVIVVVAAAVTAPAAATAAATATAVVFTVPVAVILAATTIIIVIVSFCCRCHCRRQCRSRRRCRRC